MKRWKKVALAALCLLLAAQLPFIYRRYQLGRLADAIAALDAERAASEPPADSHEDHAGVFHVHSSLGGHSPGTLQEIIHGAKVNRLAFVVMTEHPSASVNTAEATLKGVHDGVLFVNGSELTAATGERLFVVPGFGGPAAAEAPDLQTLVNRAKAEGRLSFIAYPGQVRDWRVSGFDGIEVYNLYTNAKEINYALLAFDALWSYRSYPELLFSTFYRRPDADLKRWDEVNASTGVRRAVAVAGNDSHSNVGFSFGDEAGEEGFGVKLDPYERSFRVVRNHVLLERGRALDTEALLDALRRGRSYIAFDLFCDSRGFRFTAENGSERKMMGDEIALAGGRLKLVVRVPVKSRILFFRDGQTVHEEKDALRKELTVERPGAYRVEVYLERLGGRAGSQPWIISNPIFVR
ncbi:MAG TPA: hypothetical protein VFS10_06190 [Pyrinomonadaceae bacterium]|nr:hypothetical protein [Pyrinomonadaceae bacterium]